MNDGIPIMDDELQKISSENSIEIHSCHNCKWFDDDGDRTACFAPKRIYHYPFRWNRCEKWEENR